ncbi:G-D-S-L family lipolytic protein [Flagellimonas hymeniacidonis]|uniref:G-D-S-L family lipolytic protein n=1 Tax=Flagellimonas hymeniacidonis TaxID=2603628 RepID=A0A5C8V1S7_9FLAO|nr:GDSL-type esterase/lipase family protein [Flagellimonas hymeniacidonis]TXN35099.1 G-D-S-L family lipolytic protein [Flagellimonas hymeniacidonis]
MRYLLLLFVVSLSAQEKLPFADEVKAIQQKTDSIWDSSKETLVFTGSSSIRLWNDLQERFPDKQILNTGFGGSQSTDLERFLNELILNYQPSRVFIYEGDNDISSKRTPRAIIGTMEDILEDLHKENPALEVVLISAKPSIARWHLKRRYKRLNKKLLKLASSLNGVYYADVWNTMLNKRKLKRNLFIEDGLHMNTMGYELWYEALKDYVNKNTL